MNKIGNILKSFSISDDEMMEKVNLYTRKEFKREEVYIFPVSLCNNDIDRDNEMFTLDSLNKLAEMYKGKTGIIDHNPKSENQIMRVFDTEVKQIIGKSTKVGENFYSLNAMVYLINSEKNKDIISEIDGGIKKEVSVGCSVSKTTCSICNLDNHNDLCKHIQGNFYDEKLCYIKLENPTDAYEFSFVAIPAQADAGVTKKYKTNSESEEKILFEYDEKLKEYGIDKLKFDEISITNKSIFDIVSLAIKNYIKIFNDEKKEMNFITKEKCFEVLGIEKTADEILLHAKNSIENFDKLKAFENKATLYDKMVKNEISETLAMGIRAQGDKFNNDLWTKTLNTFELEDIIKMKDEWKNQAEIALNAGNRQSQVYNSIIRTPETTKQEDYNF